jgi:hypothetical protein
MNEFNGPANYALMELLITSLVLSASSDRFFTSSYISFLYLEKKKIKIHEFFSSTQFPEIVRVKHCSEPHDRNFELQTITLLQLK